MVKSRGAQPSNKNAKTHGFYSKVLSEAEKLELNEAAGIEGLDAEIAIMRFKLQQLLIQCPDRIDLHMSAANTLARLIRTQYQITPEQKHQLKEAITSVIRDVAIPLGLKFIPGAGA